jgi:pimeloyl-ACP methyl ester carboxylesterase
MANRKLYALLIGINQYLGPVRPLRGCVNDVNNVENMLNKLFSNSFDEMHIKKLLNQEATRENVINTFYAHLIEQATENDVIYFHFSGHGSQEKAPREFFEFDTKDKNETLVCADSRLPGRYDLADKEVGVLLHLASKKTKNIIMVADSCHSGTINRGDEIGAFESRFETENPSGRGYETYLNGYLKEKNILKVPEFEGVVFAACKDKEKAQEDSKNQCGLFTSNFLKALEENRGDVSYSELYTTIRSRIESMLDTQHPEFDYGTTTSPHSLFLRDKENSAQRVQGHSVYQLKGAWRIGAGAAHGLPQDGSEFPIEIYGKESTPVAKGKITGISIASSSLEITEGTLDVNKIYRGMLLKAPVMPLKVYVPDDTARKMLEDSLNSQEVKTPSFFKLEKLDSTQAFEVELSAQEMFQLRYKKSKILISELPDAEEVNEALTKIEKKTRLSVLKNLNTSLNLNDFVLELAATNAKGEMISYTNPEVSLDYQNIEGQWRKIPINLRLENKSNEDLYFMLLHLSANFGITALYDLKLPAESGKKSVFPKAATLGIKENDLNETVDEFLLIVSDEKLDKMDFEQTEILKHIVHLRDLEVEEDDWNNKWLTKKIAVKLVRQQNTIGTEGFSLGDGKVRIQGHNALSANVSLNSSGSTRDISGNDMDIALIMERVARAQGGELFPLSVGTKTGIPQNILELTDLKQVNEVNAQNPLVLEIAADLKENEMILPFSFDGEILMPIGIPEKNTNGTQSIRISKLPEVSEPTRDLASALKMAFLKIALPDIQTNRLEWVDYSSGKAVGSSKNLAEKMANANNILLLIHGIIGDTEEMTNGLGFAQNKDICDLVLTYNYESLNTPIEITAANLKESLIAAGIKGKNLSIIAHSMGGLVARYMIEKLEGNAFVKKLITVGSPHKGSPLANLVEYRNWAMATLALSANFAKNIAYVAALVHRINLALITSSKLTITLEQMRPSSQFLAELGSNQHPNISYLAIAGNADLLKNERNGNLFERLLNEGREEMSEILSKEPNDMAVLVASALALPQSSSLSATKEVGAFHVNYFNVKSVLETIENFIRA